MSNQVTGATNGASAIEFKTDENEKIIKSHVISKSGKEPIIQIVDNPKAHEAELLGENPVVVRVNDDRGELEK